MKKLGRQTQSLKSPKAAYRNYFKLALVIFHLFICPNLSVLYQCVHIIIDLLEKMNEKDLTIIPAIKAEKKRRRGQWDSQSEYSLQEIKKSERKSIRKKITKIIHTTVVLHIDLNGNKRVTYHQVVSSSKSRNPQNINKYALQVTQHHNQQVIAQATRQIETNQNNMIQQEYDPFHQPFLRFGAVDPGMSYFPC